MLNTATHLDAQMKQQRHRRLAAEKYIFLSFFLLTAQMLFIFPRENPTSAAERPQQPEAVITLPVEPCRETTFLYLCLSLVLSSGVKCNPYQMFVYHIILYKCGLLSGGPSRTANFRPASASAGLNFIKTSNLH